MTTQNTPNTLEASNEIVRLGIYSKRHGRVIEADVVITSVQDSHRCAGFWYASFSNAGGKDGHLFGSFGAVNVPKPGTTPKPYGVQYVLPTGRKVRPVKPWSPRPGDPAYDLMH